MATGGDRGDPPREDKDGEDVGGAIESRLREAARMLSSGDPASAEAALEDLLPEAAAASQGEGVPSLLPDVHLRLARCRRARGRLREAVASCNSAIECRSESAAQTPASAWREPFLYRSACFRALHARMKRGPSEEDYEEAEAVEKDRVEADIVVDPSLEEEVEDRGESGERRQLRLRRLDKALSAAKDGETIFVEAGIYRVTSSDSDSGVSGAPYFLLGKSVFILGACAAKCVLEYSGKDSSRGASRLDTFLICGMSPEKTTFIKRLTFRNVPSQQSSSSSSSIATRFLGVAAGRVHLEDCVFDGGGGEESAAAAAADAVYASSRICGHLASSYPPPVVTARFCVFDRCRSFAAFTAMTAEANIRNCLFVGSRLSALSSASVTVEDSEFVQSLSSSDSSHPQATVSATGSSLRVRRCYVHPDEGGDDDGEGGVGGAAARRQAVALTAGSAGEVEGCYLFRTGNGVACAGSELSCRRNLVAECARRLCSPTALLAELLGGSASNSDSATESSEDEEDTLGLCTAVSVRETSSSSGKVAVAENRFVRCDVGLHAGKDSAPGLRANVVEASAFTGVFAECGAKPNVVDNSFLAQQQQQQQVPGRKKRKSRTGLGVLLVLGSRGMLARNSFSDYDLSPVMCFASCRPLLTGNSYSGVSLDRARQQRMEARMRRSFRRELFEASGPGDARFYIVDSEECEKEIRDLVLKGSEEEKNDKK